MKKLLLLILVFAASASAQYLQSPNGNLSLVFKLNDKGEAVYSLIYKRLDVIKSSRLGFEMKDQPDLKSGFTIVDTKTSEANETWNPVWGEVKTIRNNYRELAVTLQQVSEVPKGKLTRKILVRFRLFDDGLGFRYEFPVQDELKYFTINDEKTEFNLAGDHKTFWIPGDYDSQEYAYNTTKLSEIDANKGKYVDEIAVKSVFADNGVQTPLMMKSTEGLYLNIHEAALVNYPAMYLKVNRQTFETTSHLAPNAVGSAAFLQTPA